MSKPTKPSNRYMDFDRFFAERRVEEKLEPISFDYGGERFELPAQLPAEVPVKALRLYREYGADADVPPNEAMELALSVLGDEAGERLLRTGIGTDELSEVLKWVFEQYGFKAPEESEGNSAAPEETGG